MKYNYYNVKIKNIIDETSDVKTFILTKPKGFKFKSGQFIWVSLKDPGPDIPKFPMAIASGLNEQHLMFSIKSWGDPTKAIFELKKGDKVAVSDALGTYLPFNNFVGTNLYLIAGGTGITPIRSVLTSIQDEKMKKLRSKTILYYGAKTPSDFLYKDEFKKWQAKTIVETKEGHDKWKGNLGFVTKLLTNEMDSVNGICFVFGPYPMMQNVVSILKSLGFTEDQIYVSIEKMIDNQVIGPIFPVSDSNVSF